MVWQDFIRLKLAEHLHTNPTKVEHISIDSPQQSFDLRLNGNTYSIKFCNPVTISRNRQKLFWDFDLRKNFWRDGKTQKSSKDTDPSDFYILVGMIDNTPKKIHLIPADKTPTAHVRIVVDGKSKYKEYEI